MLKGLEWLSHISRRSKTGKVQKPLVLGLSPLEDKQGDYGGNQDQECNELGDTHIAP